MLIVQYDIAYFKGQDSVALKNSNTHSNSINR